MFSIYTPPGIVSTVFSILRTTRQLVDPATTAAGRKVFLFSGFFRVFRPFAVDAHQKDLS
jgi:hypothetical protein